jgi:hypothetical protein
LRQDNGLLKQRVEHLMVVIQELEEPSSEEEDDEPNPPLAAAAAAAAAAGGSIQSPVSISPSPGPSSPGSPEMESTRDPMASPDSSLQVDPFAPAAGDGLDDKYSPQARAEARKSRKKLKALVAAHSRLEQEREQHRVSMEMLRFEMENSRRVLSSYKERLGDPKVELVENVGSVGDPGRGITPGVAGVIAHRSLLDKLADTLRPGISANRPATAMVNVRRSEPISRRPKSSQVRPRSSGGPKPGRANPGWTGATLSSRPTSAFVSKLREVGGRNGGL